MLARNAGTSRYVRRRGGLHVLTRAYQHSLNSSGVLAGQPLLEVHDVTLRFGGVSALADVSFTVTQGHIHAVIGPNGAGKSSLLNCASGLYNPQDGRIVLRVIEAAGAVQQGRFAGAVRTDDGVDMTLGDGEAHVGQG